jgi:hypothetical protein
LGKAIHPAVKANITIGSNHHLAVMYHYQVKSQTSSYMGDIIVGSCYDPVVIYPYPMAELINFDA